MATVLVIEDDSTTRHLIRAIIEERGHEGAYSRRSICSFRP